MQPVDETADARDLRAEPDPLAKVCRQAQGHLGAALGHLEGLPDLLRVEAVLAGRRRLAQRREQRRLLDRACCQVERADVAPPHRGGQRIDGAQPGADRGAVEPGSVRMRPRVGRVDRGRELAPELLDPLQVGALGLGRRKPFAADDAVVEVEGRQPRRGRVARLDGQAELLDEPEVRGVEGPDQLAAELHGAHAVGRELFHAATHPVARLEHEHVGAGGRQVPRRRQSSEAGAENEDVAHPESSRRMPARIRARAFCGRSSPR